MNTAYRDAIATHGASLITHIEIVDGSGNPTSSARQPVTWTTAADGLIRPDANITFAGTAEAAAAGWRGYSALSGGTAYGGADFAAASQFSLSGQFTLLAASTSVQHNAGT